MPSLSPTTERRLLQVSIAVGGFVPVVSGLAGAILGSSVTGEGGAGASLDSHVRYLSGLLLGIGLAFWEAIPYIERCTTRIRLLTAFVVLGGLLRLIAIFAVAVPSGTMLFGVAMELVVTPLICLWQGHVARRFGEASTQAR